MKPLGVALTLSLCLCFSAFGQITPGGTITRVRPVGDNNIVLYDTTSGSFIKDSGTSVAGITNSFETFVLTNDTRRVDLRSGELYVDTPVVNPEAANKAYVDAQVAAAGATNSIESFMYIDGYSTNPLGVGYVVISNWTAGVSDGITLDGAAGTATLSADGRYAIVVTLGLSGDNSTVYEFAVHTNGFETVSETLRKTPNNDVGSCSLAGIYDLNNGDVIDLRGKYEEAGVPSSAAPVMRKCQFLIWRVVSSTAGGGGGGAGTITSRVDHIYPDSVALTHTNGNSNAQRVGYNMLSDRGLPVYLVGLEFDDTVPQYTSPQILYPTDTWDSNLHFDVASYAAATGGGLLEVWYAQDGGNYNMVTSPTLHTFGLQITNTTLHSYSLNLPDAVAGVPLEYLVTREVADLITGNFGFSIMKIRYNE